MFNAYSNDWFHGNKYRKWEVCPYSELPNQCVGISIAPNQITILMSMWFFTFYSHPPFKTIKLLFTYNLSFPKPIRQYKLGDVLIKPSGAGWVAQTAERQPSAPDPKSPWAVLGMLWGDVTCAQSSPLASFLMWLPAVHFQESLTFATATAFCVAATHELSSKSTVSGRSHSFSAAFKGDKWYGIPSSHLCASRTTHL